LNPRIGRWGARLLALAAGSLAAVAHPPFGFLPGLLGYALLLQLVDTTEAPRPLHSAFFRGWLGGFAYFFIGCWWIAEAFLVDAEGQGWMAPIAITLVPAGLALFWGAACALYRRLKPEGAVRVLAFAGALAGFEWLRGHLLTGFPWNLPGETWAAGSPPSQAAALIGAYGLTWVTVAIAAACAVPFRGSSRRQGLVTIAVALAGLAALYGYGWVRLSNPPSAHPRAPVVRVVQANVAQEKKYDAASFRSIVERYTALTAQPGARRPDIVVWPEGAIPAAADEFLAPGGWTLEAIQASLQNGQTLILGAYRIGGTAAEPTYFNSLITLRAEPAGLRVTGLYDKHRLVPFGEFLPLESALAPMGIKNLTKIGDGFSHGPPPAPISPLAVPRTQPLICYEVLFPDLVRRAVVQGPRPRWIVNVSNDAWYGPTSGPWQHLNIAAYRSIETGLPMVRATPTGVSAVIDAFGRSSPATRIGMGRAGILDVSIPAATMATPFVRLGEFPFAALLVISLLSCIRRRHAPRVSSAVRKEPYETEREAGREARH
jgi:apolipoprotein N-acyltransferase